MRSIEVSEAKSGMVLARAVYNHQRVLLFVEGTELRDKDVWVLKSWGIKEMVICDGEKEAGREDPENEGERTTDHAPCEELRKKFNDVLDDPVMAEIMRVANKLLDKRHAGAQGDHGNNKSVPHN